MKQVLMALLITAFAYTGAEAQTTTKTVQTKTTETKTVQTPAKPAETKWVCKPVTTKPAAAKRKTAVKTTTETTSPVTACRMVPYLVCSILPGRRSVSCYTTTDGVNQTQTGPTTYYGPTGPMPGELVKSNIRTIVIKGETKVNYCKRNEANDATVCYQRGYLVRDEDGYYSYGEVVPQHAIGIEIAEHK
jgi:hypothetical protein